MNLYLYGVVTNQIGLAFLIDNQIPFDLCHAEYF